MIKYHEHDDQSELINPHVRNARLAGTPEWVVARRLGHTHVQTTLDLYGWVREDEALRAAANWKTYISAWQVDDGR
jgi:integrase